MRIAVLMLLASTWSREVVLRLSELGHTIDVVDFTRPRAGEKRGYVSHQDLFQAADISSFCKSVAGVHLLESRFSSGLRYLTCAGKLAEILRTCGAEVLLTLYGGGFAAMAYVSRFRPYVVYAVGSDILMAKGMSRRLARIVLNSATAVVANGAYLAEQTRHLAPNAKVLPLYLGVDTNRFSPGVAPLETINIVCTRGFLPVYNNEYLIHGLQLLPNLMREFTVTFVSSGPLLDAVRARADRILRSSIRQNVKFVGGVDNDHLIEILKSSHIYVSVSRSDGTSASLLEALACGLFPIVSDIPQNREWINEEANNGILVRLDKPEALATALVQAISDESWRKSVVDYNRRLVLERANSHQNIPVLSSILESRIFSGVQNPHQCVE